MPSRIAGGKGRRAWRGRRNVHGRRDPGDVEAAAKEVRHGVGQLFGSYARGEATADSDIDVLLRKNEGARVMNVFGVAEELHCASGKDVDVHEISELNDGPFRDTVLADAIPLCGKAPFPGDDRVGKRGHDPASLTTPERAGNPAGPSGGIP